MHPIYSRSPCYALNLVTGLFCFSAAPCSFGLHSRYITFDTGEHKLSFFCHHRHNFVPLHLEKICSSTNFELVGDFLLISSLRLGSHVDIWPLIRVCLTGSRKRGTCERLTTRTSINGNINNVAKRRQLFDWSTTAAKISSLTRGGLWRFGKICFRMTY